MNLTVLCVGRTREGFVREGIEKYLRFLRPFAEVALREIREEKGRDLTEAALVRKREAGRILRAIPASAVVIALDERGREFTSHEFAAFLNGLTESGARHLVFVLGGAMGLDGSVTERAQHVLALSRWTLTHDMARLVLLEQLYRSFTIITGRTYHI